MTRLVNSSTRLLHPLFSLSQQIRLDFVRTNLVCQPSLCSSSCCYYYKYFNEGQPGAGHQNLIEVSRPLYIRQLETAKSAISTTANLRLAQNFPLQNVNRFFHRGHVGEIPQRFLSQSISQHGLHTSAWCLQEGGPPVPEIKPPGTFKSFVIKKYMGYLEKFDASFERKYPRVYKVYKLFKDGVREFFGDTKIYYGVATQLWSGQPLSSFTRKQLEIYQQMPGDMLHSAPLLITVPLPFVPYFFFPLAYMFPRQLLCRHFWTEEQRKTFAMEDVKHKAAYYPRVIKYVEGRVEKIRDESQRNMFNKILQDIIRGDRVDIGSLCSLRSLFISYPFGLTHLQKRHRIHYWNLCHSSGVSRSQSKLTQQLLLQHNIDLALHREGLQSLSPTELIQACFSRGLAAGDLTETQMKEFLTDWLQLAQCTDETSLSLLLHAPALLGSRFSSTHQDLNNNNQQQTFSKDNS